MQYLEKSLQVRSALLRRVDLLETIRAIFQCHITGAGTHQPVGRGASRVAYNVGTCEVASGTVLHLLLKLHKDRTFLRYAVMGMWRSEHNGWGEIGAFETYYDFVAGHITEVTFRSHAAHDRYRANSILGREVPYSFSLHGEWGGTRVAPGDLGAVPYFQLVVRHGEWFGQLTEGIPSLIEPRYTANWRDTYDRHTVEEGRIIDLGPSHCLLIDIDRGGHLDFGERYPGNIGVRRRGEKYFFKRHRLDL